VADIFDQVAAPPQTKGDIFDRVAPQPTMRVGKGGLIVSDLLPPPELVDQQATQQGRAIAEAATRPPSTGSAIGNAYSEFTQALPRIFSQGAIGQSLEADKAAAQHPPGLKPRPGDPKGPGMNAPVLDFTQLTPEPGIARGAAEFASGLTSPTNIAIMAATGGLAALEKQIGTGLFSRMVSAGFSVSMLDDLVKETPQLADAIQKGGFKSPEARQILTRMTLTGAMAHFAARHAIGGETPATTARPQDIFDRAEQEQSHATQPETRASQAEAQPTSEPAAQGQPHTGPQPGEQPQPALQPAAEAPVASPVTKGPVNAPGHTGDQRPEVPPPPERNLGAGGVEPPVPQRNESGALPGLPGPGGSGSTPGEPAQHGRSESADTGRSAGPAPVPIEHVVAEAKRQEKYQMVREGESKQDAEQHARDNTATIEDRGKTHGGYLRVDVPVEMLAADKTHVDEARQERLEKIGGTSDPIFITDPPIVVDGQKKLSVVNGNNRIAYAEKHGLKSVPAFVTREAWEGMQQSESVAEQPQAAEPKPRVPTTPPAYGRNVNVAVPGEQTTYPARYALRESADVQPSHNPQTFDANPNYEYANDRDYKGNKEISSLVVEHSGPLFDPNYLASESPTAEHGGPVIDARGNVLGGNSRSMTLGRVYESNPEGAAAYKSALRERAGIYGLTPEDVDRFQQPVLVRELTEQPDAAGAQRAVTDFNKKGAAELAPEEQAVADGRRMSTESVERIAAKLQDVGEDSTLAQALERSNGAEIVDGLVKDGVISPQERSALVDHDRDVLTPQGKDRIAKMLVGRMFETPADMKNTPPQVRNNLEKVAPQILRIEGRPEWSITPQVREAVGILAEAREHGIRNVKDLVNQTRIDGPAKQYSPEAVEVAEALGSGPNKAARAFRQFANDEILSREGAQAAFFEPPTRAEAFDAAFGQQAAWRHSQKGAAPLEVLSLGAGKFLEQDVAPALRSAAINVVSTADDILKVLAPTLRGGERVELGKLAMRKRLGELARRSDQARAALRQAEHFFNRQTQAHNYEFWDRIEQGDKQQNAALDAIAAVLRPLLDGRRKDVQSLGTGKLQTWYENYFPRAWEDPRRATQVIRDFFNRRPFEGGKSFLKKRTYPTMKEGRDAGLKPLTDNPVTMALWKIQEMDRYIAAHRTLNDWKAEGSAKFVDARNVEIQKAMTRGGWKKIEDPIGTVYGPSIQQIAEYPNEGKWKGLQAVADALEITQKRGFLNLRNALGRASRSGTVSTLHGTAEDVLGHEIGHQIDFRAGSGQRFVIDYPDAQTVARLREAYKTIKDTKGTSVEARRDARQTIASLKDKIQQRKEFAKQLRDLADLREGRKEYTHKREEKMALLAQMWTDAREQFQRTAPMVFNEWKAFLEENPKLHGLRDLEGNAKITELSQPYDVGGLVIKGHYWAPEGLARLMDNHLMPGLVEKSGLFRGILGLNNHLNLYNLGLSVFHVGKTTLEATISKGALAYEALLRGHPLTFAKNLAEVPVAPFTAAIRGNRMLKEWYGPGSEGTEIGMLADKATSAGARARMDSIYRTRVREQFTRALSQGNLPGALLRAPSAAMETMTSLIMDQVVPRLKFGVFADMASQHLEQMGATATSLTVDRAMANDWNSVENRLGEVTRDNLFWNRYARDLSTALLRADQWFLGTVREVGGGLADLIVQPVRAMQGKPVNLNRATYIASMITVHMLYSGLYQYLKTGKGPEEPEDWFFPRNGEKDELGRPQRSSIPSYVKDVYGLGTHFWQTMKNKLAPSIPLIGDLATNSDFYHTQIRNPEDSALDQAGAVGKFILQQFTPLSIRNLQKENALGGSAATKAEQFVGITPAPAEMNQGPAERFTRELQHEHGGGETVSKEDAERRRLRNELTRALRSGKTAPAEVIEARRQGKMSIEDVRQAVRSSKETPLQAAFVHLTLDDALRTYKVANPEERKALRPLLLKKAQAAISIAAPVDRKKTVEKLRDALNLANK